MKKQVVLTPKSHLKVSGEGWPHVGWHLAHGVYMAGGSPWILAQGCLGGSSHWDIIPHCSSVCALLPLDQKPKEKRGSAAKVSQEQPSAPSTLDRISTLVSTASHRAYQQTTHGLQRAKAKGQELAILIPIVVSDKTSSPQVPAPSLFWAIFAFG